VGEAALGAHALSRITTIIPKNAILLISRLVFMAFLLFFSIRLRDLSDLILPLAYLDRWIWS